MPAREQVTLVGAGLAGVLLSISLVERGFDVRIYERRPDMRTHRISAGRSINLALSTRGIHALKQAGVWPRIDPLLVTMKGRMMHAVSGDLTFQPYGKDAHEVINSVSRAALNIALLDAAESAGVTIHFEQRCIARDFDHATLTLRDERTALEATIPAPIVIASDGATSALRATMEESNRTRATLDYLNYGYKEINIPATHDNGFAMEPHALHIWPRGTDMLIALPNRDGSFGCILFLPFDGDRSFATLKQPAQVDAFFAASFPDVVPLLPNLTQEFFTNPTGSMVTVHCAPWHTAGNTLLFGDAAHAIVPFFGQGMNCAFEDCTVLLELLDAQSTHDWPTVFSQFQNARLENTNAIAELALGNFVEMRDRVADPHFLLGKKVELALESRYPAQFVPKYSMVTFHRVPYTVARERGTIQDQILTELCRNITSVDQLDWSRAHELIDRHLTPLASSDTEVPA
jgi:kynurenine 3-monooxygenase